VPQLPKGGFKGTCPIPSACGLTPGWNGYTIYVGWARRRVAIQLGPNNDGRADSMVEAMVGIDKKRRF